MNRKAWFLFTCLALASSVSYSHDISITQLTVSANECEIGEFGWKALKKAGKSFIYFKGDLNKFNSDKRHHECVIRVARNSFESHFQYCFLSGSEIHEHGGSDSRAVGGCRFQREPNGDYRFNVVEPTYTGTFHCSFGCIDK
jgi:hypothetical protein